MDINLQPGLTETVSLQVTKEMTASVVGSGEVDVFATPMMIMLMEQAAYKAVAGEIPPGTTTVGTHMDASHLAATPVGMEVKATAELLIVEGKKLVFKVEAFDEKDCIGKGTHTRFIVDSQRFHAKAAEK